MKSKAPDSIASRYWSISPSREHTTKGARDPASFNVWRTSWKLPSGRMSSADWLPKTDLPSLVYAGCKDGVKPRVCEDARKRTTDLAIVTRHLGWTADSPHLSPGPTTCSRATKVVG